MAAISRLVARLGALVGGVLAATTARGVDLPENRAEAMVRAHDQRAADVISQAGGRIGDHRYAQGVLLRARGLHEGDETHLRHALSLFEEIGCPYQAARTGWLLGGEARKQAERTFTSLGATLPPD